MRMKDDGNILFLIIITLGIIFKIIQYYVLKFMYNYFFLNKFLFVK